METKKLSFEEEIRLFMEALKQSRIEARIEAEENMKRSRIEAEENMKRSRIEAKENMKQFKEQLAASSADFEKRMKIISEQLGGIGNNNGYFAEEFFYNAVEKGSMNFFGEKYDRIMKSIKGLVKPDEYDIVMVNGKSACIIETKYKANEKHIEQVMKKAETFRYNFKEYKDHTLYLGLASMAFYQELEEECKRNGIAIIKQVGDAIVVNHEHLKEY